MYGNDSLARVAPVDGGVVMRAARALDGQRLAAVALVTLLLSLGALVSPALLDFFSPAELALAARRAPSRLLR
jgi:hypothetical protein